MIKIQSYLKITLLVLLSLSLVACNDDDDDDDDADNNAPAFLSTWVDIEVAENTTGVIYIARATDADGNTIEYSLAGGEDRSQFSISATSGELYFQSPPDYESPSDSDQNNKYEVEIRASDDIDTTTMVLIVEVTDVDEDDANEAPIAVISVSPDPDTSVITTDTTVTLDGSGSSDPDGDELSFEWTQPGGQNIGLVFISTSDLSSPTFSAASAGTYTFTLTVSDGELQDSEVVTLVVHPVTIPSDFSAIAGDSEVTLTWTPYSDETTYSIYRSSDPNCDPAVANVWTNCSDGAEFAGVDSGLVDTGLTNGTTYYYWIEATLDGIIQRSILPISATPQQPTSGIVATRPLNDTGIDWGGDYNKGNGGNNADCSSDISAPQDCDYGRDATHNDDSDGHAGFSFTKLDSNGNPLAASATEWSCVQDNVTGLIWEAKTDDGGLHSIHDTYNWYNTDPATNGGSEGYSDYYGPDDLTFCYGYDPDDSATHCNTEAFAARVNAVGLCGATDWRVPDMEELRSIVDYSRDNPSIDIDYFPDLIEDNLYWSASPYAHNYHYAWVLNFSIGNYIGYQHHYKHYVRLVRVGQ